jgi:hypothetical protein
MAAVSDIADQVRLVGSVGLDNVDDIVRSAGGKPALAHDIPDTCAGAPRNPN